MADADTVAVASVALSGAVLCAAWTVGFTALGHCRMGARLQRAARCVAAAAAGTLLAEWHWQLLGTLSEPCGAGVDGQLLRLYGLERASARCWRSAECVVAAYGAWGCVGVTAAVARMTLGGVVMLGITLFG